MSKGERIADKKRRAELRAKDPIKQHKHSADYLRRGPKIDSGYIAPQTPVVEIEKKKVDPSELIRDESLIQTIIYLPSGVVDIYLKPNANPAQASSNPSLFNRRNGDYTFAQLDLKSRICGALNSGSEILERLIARTLGVDAGLISNGAYFEPTSDSNAPSFHYKSYKERVRAQQPNLEQRTN